MVAHIMPADPFSAYPPPPPPPTLGMGSVGRNSTFSEHGHLAYQLRESRMQQHGSKYFARSPHTHINPPPPWDVVDRSKINFVRTLSCCIRN